MTLAAAVTAAAPTALARRGPPHRSVAVRAHPHRRGSRTSLPPVGPSAAGFKWYTGVPNERAAASKRNGNGSKSDFPVDAVDGMHARPAFRNLP
jgi:hypothetical protein